jgi:hypothetical protein
MEGRDQKVVLCPAIKVAYLDTLIWAEFRFDSLSIQSIIGW